MKPGDAIYFSGNLLHCSLPNVSNKPRWSYVIAYNQRHNQTYMKPGHPLYTPHPGYIPLLKVPDSTILTCEENFDMDKKWVPEGEEDLTGTATPSERREGTVVFVCFVLFVF
nr:uncharacterized protein LOC113807851 [Penaeus vannamei]